MKIYTNIIKQTFLFIASCVYLIQADAFPSYLDPETGKNIYQLTSTPGNNYGLYYHQGNWNNGYYLIYRNMTNASSASVTYYRLDLEDETVTPLTATGLCNGATVQENYLYCFYRSDVSQPYSKIIKLNIRTQSQSDVCMLDQGWESTGDITVNRDSSYLIYVQTWNDYRQAYKCQISSGARTRLINTTEQIEHFQFSPTNAQWYTYINQSNSGLARVGVGRIDTEQNSMLYSNDSYLNSVGNYAHPFYGKDGHLWADALWSSQTSQIYVVRFTLGATVGSIASYSLVPIGNGDWQVHFNAAHDGNWFVGDGKGNLTSLGEGYISRLMLNAWDGSSARVKLASAIGTYSENAHHQANAHYIESKNWVVWSAFRTLQGNDSGAQNIFAVDFW